MEGHSFSSLKDILSSTSPKKTMFMESTPASSLDLNKGVHDPDVFGEISLEESPASSLHSLVATLSFSTLSFSSSSSSSYADLSPQTENQKLKECALESFYGKKNGKEEGNVKHSITTQNVDFGRRPTGRAMYPPPISCLKLFKTGRPYAYLRFNEDDGSFSLEEIRIPHRNILYASREYGRLKLYFINTNEEILEKEEADHEEEEVKENEEMNHSKVEGKL